MLEANNIEVVRYYNGGKFECISGKTVYVGGQLTLRFGIRVEEFTYKHVISTAQEIMEGKQYEVWFKLHGKSLKTGKRRIGGEVDMVGVIKSKDKYDSIDLYLVERQRIEDPSEHSMFESRPNPRTENVSYREAQPHKTLISSSSEQHLPRNLSAFDTQQTTLQTLQNRLEKLVPWRKENVVEDVDAQSDEDFEGDHPIWEEENDYSDLAEEGEEDYVEKVDLFTQDANAYTVEEVVRNSREHVDTISQKRSKYNVNQGLQGDSRVYPRLWGVDDVEVTLGNEEDYEHDSDDLCSLAGSDNEVDGHTKFNPNCDFRKKIDLRVGLKFPDVYEFRKALRQHAIENGYEFYYLHNGSRKVRVHCKHRCACEWNSKRSKLGECKCNSKRKCEYMVYAKQEEDTFQVRSLNLEHLCGYRNQNRMLSSEFIAEKYLEVWRGDPNWSLKGLKDRVLMDLNVEVGYHKCWLARARAMLLIYGNGDDQYAGVWDYAATLRKYNPGSSSYVVLENIDRPPSLFQRMYICLQACKEGFVKGCRPLIGVDGCHLKGQYPGMCLVAVAKDGNNNIFPVAWSVVEVENTATWQWFLDLLVTDLQCEEGEGLTFMSDRQKGLIDALKAVSPKAESRYCVRHIWATFKLQFTGQAFKESFWKAARATTQKQFDFEMEGIKFLSEPAYEYLKAIPAKHWSRHAFSTQSKSCANLNNMCETFNSVLKDCRDKPILTHMEWMRRYVMKRACEKREGVAKYDKKIMPYVDKSFKRVVNETRFCTIARSEASSFEVDYNGRTSTVNLIKRECSCYLWSLNGIPCVHAVACILSQRHILEDYVDTAYTKEKYILAYTPSIKPMPGMDEWEKTDNPKPLPPAHRKMPGRPSKKKRRKEPGEGEGKYVKRTKKSNKCSRCGILGHNVKTCKSPPASKPNNRGGRPPTNSPWVKAAKDKQVRRKAWTNTDAPTQIVNHTQNLE